MEPQRDVLFLDTRYAPLPLAMRDQYLADVHGWVIGLCRAAAQDRATLSLIDGLYGNYVGAWDVARWRSIGPHASIRRELQLSDDAIAILLLTAAPKLWGALQHVYSAIVMPTCSYVVTQPLLAKLIDDRRAVLRELHRDAPLMRSKLVTMRPTGAIAANPAVVQRLIAA
jgi:hypothetical protein